MNAVAHPAQAFAGDRPKWCPGCGNYAVIAQLQRALAETMADPARTVIVSGIGCSSRLPYHMNTYGFHSIHGRAPALATGLKLIRPDLGVWVVTGDGDALSIGTNHFVHALRRNDDLKVILLNNRVYGLTKGQASPTSAPGTTTKSTPFGTLDTPIDPIMVALVAGATFVARTVDGMSDHLLAMLKRAAEHRGSAVVEVLQNCRIFNNGAWHETIGPDVRDEQTVLLEHGRPLMFGSSRHKAIALSQFGQPEIFEVDTEAGTRSVLIHDETLESPLAAMTIAHLPSLGLPLPLGVFRAVRRATHHESLARVQAKALQQDGGTLQELLDGDDGWSI